jgi:hypothetical protein
MDAPRQPAEIAVRVELHLATARSVQRELRIASAVPPTPCAARSVRAVTPERGLRRRTAHERWQAPTYAGQLVLGSLWRSSFYRVIQGFRSCLTARERRIGASSSVRKLRRECAQPTTTFRGRGH